MPSQRRWNILAQDGRHVTIGRAAPRRSPLRVWPAGSPHLTATTGRADACPSHQSRYSAKAPCSIGPPRGLGASRSETALRHVGYISTAANSSTPVTGLETKSAPENKAEAGPLDVAFPATANTAVPFLNGKIPEITLITP